MNEVKMILLHYFYFSAKLKKYLFIFNFEIFKIIGYYLINF